MPLWWTSAETSRTLNYMFRTPRKQYDSFLLKNCHSKNSISFCLAHVANECPSDSGSAIFFRWTAWYTCPLSKSSLRSADSAPKQPTEALSPPLFENEYTRRPSFRACSAGRVYSSLARKGLCCCLACVSFADGFIQGDIIEGIGDKKDDWQYGENIRTAK